MKSLIFKNQSGVAAVEFAILLPVLLLLVFGTIDLASLVYNKQILTNAAREGARAAIVFPMDQTMEEAKAYMEEYCENAPLFNFSEKTTAENLTASVEYTNVKDAQIATIKYKHHYLLDGFLGINFGPTDIEGKTEMWKEIEEIEK